MAEIPRDLLRIARPNGHALHPTALLVLVALWTYVPARDAAAHLGGGPPPRLDNAAIQRALGQTIALDPRGIERSIQQLVEVGVVELDGPALLLRLPAQVRAGATSDASAALLTLEALALQELADGGFVPVEGSEHLDALGIRLGQVSESNPLLRAATLPEGWRVELDQRDTRVAFLLDASARRRVRIFYKAMPHDRRAWCHVLEG